MTDSSSPAVSRRRFLETMGLAAAAAYLSPRLLADTPLVDLIKLVREGSPIIVTPLRGNVTALTGSGGNIGVLTGTDGTLLVDSGVKASQPKITAALAKMQAGPVRRVINTHWHFDHTDGNEWLHAAGAEITAHANTRRHLATDTTVGGWNHTFPASPAGALPTTTIMQDETIRMNGTTVALTCYSPAHTDSDLAVQFTEADILQTGDTFWNGFYPFIDYWTGGSLDGAIQAAEANVARTSDKTIVIPGHGPIGNRANLVEFRNMLVEVRDRVSGLKRQGRTLPEVIAAAPTAALDEKWGRFVVSPRTFVGLVYRGV